MSDENDRDETVFRPSGAPPPPPPDPRAGAVAAIPPEIPAPGGSSHHPGGDPAVYGEGETVFSPGIPPLAAIAGPAPAPAPYPAATQPPLTMAGTSNTGFAPGAGRIKVGDVLNHMFEVTRFIARGGMGEVFEGRNIMSGERMAIKVILPALAADPKVAAMFRKEANALQSVQHEAVVRYVVQAREPQLGCEYIVTGFIEGLSLSDALGNIQPSVEELIALTRRIASGLKKAHDVGVVHRDISPDNILLENDRLDRARVIDFGIVKDTNAGAHTIIDNGFAGKMKFVAPEQLGDFGHSVGNWSDVYSLALVILALAQGEPVDLAGSPVDAITKRRNGIDTSGAPEPLRSVLDRMLVPDPAQRMRSMDEVIAALDQLALPQGGGKGGHKGGSDAGQKPVAKADAATAGGKMPPRKVLIGGGVAAGVALLAGAGFIAFGGKSAPSQSTTTALPAGKTVALEDVQQAILASLPNVACSWVDVAARADGGGFSLAGEGVSSQPAQVESQMYDAVRQTGAKMTSSDFSKVAPIDASYCSTLDALRSIRDTGAARLMASQPRYELAKLTDGESAGQVGAKVVTNISLDGLTDDFAMYAIEKSNVVSQIFGSRAQFMETAKSNFPLTQIGKDKYRLTIDAAVQPGWSGVVLITGRGSFSDKPLSDLGSAEGRARFSKVAQANGWKASIAWYKFVDDIPN